MHPQNQSRSLLQIAVFTLLVTLVGLSTQSCQSRVGDPHDHDQFYVLEGKHLDVSCEGCHTDGFAGTKRRCSGCHEPDRPIAHYVGDCGECHTAFGWLGENESGEPPHPCMDEAVHDVQCMILQNVHDLQCVDCHPSASNFVYVGLDRACASCHEAERPDDHYPTEACEACHREPIYQWEDGLEHDVEYGGLRFLVQTQHKTPKYPDQINAQCVDCHPNEPAQFTPYSCLSAQCHPNDAYLESVHSVAYEYNEDSCMSCHAVDLNP